MCYKELRTEIINKTKEWNLSQLKKNVKRNLLKFWSKPKQAIKAVLGNLKPQLDLSHLKNENGIITDDIDEIKNIVLKHFKSTLKKRQFTLTDDWKKTYEDLLIDSCI